MVIAIRGEVWQWAMVGVDTLVLYLLRTWYKDKVKAAQQIENIATYEISSSLREVLGSSVDGALPYACVEGLTQAMGDPLHSQFSSTRGVIQQIKYIEHKSKRTSGYWSDAKKMIRDQTNVCPFAIAGSRSQNPVLVEVADPLSAEYLLDNLQATYDHYTPSTDSIINRGIDRLFGEVSKGYQETEKMLGVGVRLLGVGRLVLSGGRIILEAPEDGRRFILSTLSKKQVISDLKSDARVIKVFMWLLGVCGGGLLAYLAYNNVKAWYAQYKIHLMYREIEEGRRQNQQRAAARAMSPTATDDGEDTDMSDTCLICVSAPREVVILECGHVCMCGDCATILPEPRKCPVCRGAVTRYIPLYRS